MQMITYGLYNSPMGEMVIGATDQGVCWVGFNSKKYDDLASGIGNAVDMMKDYFAGAYFERDDQEARLWAERILTAWESGHADHIPLDLQGTEFQKKVWGRLLAIQKGQTQSYSDIAGDIGQPDAARAVGSAVGSNPVSLLVPCHRVLPKSGGTGNYLWGSEMKAEILAAESAA